MNKGIKSYISIILLVLGAVALWAAWYAIDPGDAMGWSVLSTAVIWPVIVAAAYVIEIAANGEKRALFYILVLVLGLAVSFAVRFLWGALVSGVIAVLIVGAVHAMVQKRKTQQ